MTSRGFLLIIILDAVFLIYGYLLGKSDGREDCAVRPAPVASPYTYL